MRCVSFLRFRRGGTEAPGEYSVKALRRAASAMRAQSAFKEGDDDSASIYHEISSSLNEICSKLKQLNYVKLILEVDSIKT